jgi:hypothetical protein
MPGSNSTWMMWIRGMISNVHDRGHEQQRRPVVDPAHEQPAADVEGDLQRALERPGHVDAPQVLERAVIYVGRVTGGDPAADALPPDRRLAGGRGMGGTAPPPGSSSSRSHGRESVLPGDDRRVLHGRHGEMETLLRRDVQEHAHDPGELIRAKRLLLARSPAEAELDLVDARRNTDRHPRGLPSVGCRAERVAARHRDSDRERPVSGSECGDVGNGDRGGLHVDAGSGHRIASPVPHDAGDHRRRRGAAHAFQTAMFEATGEVMRVPELVEPPPYAWTATA